MKYIFCISLFTFGCLPALHSQVIAHASIHQPSISLRGNAVVVGQITINAPANGRVILRFDGHCISSVGDRIVLAASETNNWGPNDGSVEVEAADADVNSNAFSHTRSYGVDAGETTFYAIAQNSVEMDGTGIASIFGSLTAEWFPVIAGPGKAFAEHKGFFYENIFMEGAPTVLNQISINPTVPGKVIVRFDGKCVSTYGDLMFFAASNTPNWTNYDGSASNEVIDDALNRFSFAHVRVYDVTPGSHTFYAVAENYYETYGNGFVSIYGSLTVQFYPDAAATVPVFQAISTPFGVNIEGPPVPVGQINLNAPVAGKVELNFAGTCIGNYGDQIRLAASDGPNWAPNDGNINFEPYSSDLNRVSFSHTRVYDVLPGDHDFYAVVQNYEEFDGGGLAVVYASLTAKFFPSETIDSQEPEVFSSFKISPNPANDMLHIQYPELAGDAFLLTLCDQNGRVLKMVEKAPLDYSEQMTLQLFNLPAGMYFLKVVSTSGAAVRRFVLE